MARSRIIKPGFFVNEQLAECDPLARLLFGGLWTVADREGRLEDRPKRIKAELLPYDNCDVDDLLSQLATHEFIQRYTAADQRYIQINNWQKHQQPHYKEVESLIPAPEGHTDSAYVAFGVTEAKRQEIFGRDGFKCVLCGSTEKLSLDHIIPRSRGGTDDDDNLQTLCGRCNSSKNNRIASETVRQPLSNKEVTSVQGQSNVSFDKARDDSLVTSYLNLDTGSISKDSAGADIAPDDFDLWFAQFWKLYPKKLRKPNAERAARRLPLRDRPLVIQAVKNYIRSDKVLNGYVKEPPGFLNDGFWKDYVAAPINDAPVTNGTRQGGAPTRAPLDVTKYNDPNGPYYHLFHKPKESG